MENLLTFTSMKSGVILYCLMRDEEIAKKTKGMRSPNEKPMVESITNSQLYMPCVKRMYGVVSIIIPVKCSTCELHCYSLYDMADLFSYFNGQSHGRYLAFLPSVLKLKSRILEQQIF